jgi:hypothetical protein
MAITTAYELRPAPLFGHLLQQILPFSRNSQGTFCICTVARRPRMKNETLSMSELSCACAPHVF